MESFDLIVIGSGSGLDVANAAAQSGLSVAIIEKGRMGGTCLNVGCIPSKLLIHSADTIEAIRSAATFGIRIEKYSVDFASIMRRTNDIIDKDSEGIRDAFEGIDNPKLFAGTAKFIGEKTISVGQHVLTADRMLLATGSRPDIPPIKGLKDTDFVTSDQAMKLTEQPKVLTIIGGGLIAAELAHFFGSLGTSINIIQKAKTLVSNEDGEISTKFTEVFSSKYSVYLNQNVEAVEKGSDGQFKVTTVGNGKKTTIESDQLLVATGRVPNSDLLDLDKGGIETDDRGFIKVDKYLQTNIKGVFALGDAVGRYMLKHAANHEAKYAFHNLLHYSGNDAEKKIAVDYSVMPYAIFSSPQIAGVGQTEEELQLRKTVYKKSVYKYIDSAMGIAIDDKDGFVKILVSAESDNYGQLLGCHIIGAHASVLIHEIIVAMKVGLTAEAIANIIHIHPALSEVVSRAASQF